MSGQKILYKTQSVCKIDSQAFFRLHVDLKSQAEIKNLLESKRENIFNIEETTKNNFGLFLCFSLISSLKGLLSAISGDSQVTKTMFDLYAFLCFCFFSLEKAAKLYWKAQNLWSFDDDDCDYDMIWQKMYE